MSSSPLAIAQEAEQVGFQCLYIDGGQLIQSFLRAGLITDLTVTTVPVLIGAGRPLFGVLSGDVPLALMASRAHPFGFVQSSYELLVSQV